MCSIEAHVNHLGWARKLRAALVAIPVALVALGAVPAAAKSVALLVGVADYGGTTRSLYGPANDVAALAERLTRYWGFNDADIVRLVDARATRAAILRELAALELRSSEGDTVLIYLSGHGVSMYASEQNGGRNSFMPDSSGGAFVAADSMLRFNRSRQAATLYEDLVVGRRDIRPVVEALDKAGRYVTLIADACYSGNLLRSSDQLLVPRLLPTLGEDVRELLRDMSARSASNDPALRNIYRNANILTSAAAGETAADLPPGALTVFPTVDGKPHGAMTDALLRILDGSLPADIDGDGVVSFAEVHRVAHEFMDARRYGHSPQRIPSVAETASAVGAFLNRKPATQASRARWPSQRSLRLYVDTSARAHAAQALAIGGVNEVTGRNNADAMLFLHRGQLQLTNASGGAVVVADPAAPNALINVLAQTAFAERLHAQANAGQRSMLEFEIDPHVFGGNLVIGQKIALVVKPDRAAYLLVINVDANGRVSTLYPKSARERTPLLAGQRRVIPGESDNDRIDVTPPTGSDYLFAFAFDSQPDEYDKLARIEQLPVTDPAVARIERLLSQSAGKYAYGRAILRTFAAPANPSDK